MSEPPKEKKPAVVFEPEAYLKALLHVLRFASNGLNKDSWVEVYGWLIGKLEGPDNKIVHVFDAVPIHHGKDVEVTWDAEAYVRAAEFDEQLYQKAEESPQYKNFFVVGWYHSHPGLDFFLSPTDVTNHLGFQGPNPNSIAIVFDHTKIVPYKHLGFKIFRLENATPDSEYKEIDFDKNKFSKDVVDVIYQAGAVVERIQGNQLLTSEIGEVPSIFAHLMLPGATPQVDKTPPIDLDALFDKMLKSTELLIQKVLGNSIIGKLASDMNPALEEWYSAFIPYVISSLNKWLMSTAEKIITTNKLALGSVYTIAGALEKSLKNVNEWTKAQLSDSERHLKKLVESTHSKLSTQLQEKLGAQETTMGKQISTLTEQIVKSENGIAGLGDKIATLVGSMESLQNSIAGIEKKLEGLESSVQARMQDQFNAMNSQVDVLLKGVDARMKEQVSAQFQDLGKDVAATKDTIKAELRKISETLVQEKQGLEDLAASKSIKKMQEDLHKMVSK